jgi:hypothetical protein
MLGTPHVLRSGHTPLDPPDATIPEAAWLSTVAEKEIQRLRDDMPMLEDHDAREHEMAMHGLEPTPDSELARLKKYENACMRRKQWAYDRLMARKRMQHPNTHQGDRKPTPMPVGTSPADPEPEPDEYARLVDVPSEPEPRDPATRFYHFKQMDPAERARFQAWQANAALAEAAAPPVPPALPKPVEAVRPASPFTGNRRERRAAKKKARQSG